jgi:hypothetical protein
VTLWQFLSEHPILSCFLLVILLGGLTDIFNALRGNR